MERAPLFGHRVEGGRQCRWVGGRCALAAFGRMLNHTTGYELAATTKRTCWKKWRSQVECASRSIHPPPTANRLRRQGFNQPQELPSHELTQSNSSNSA